MEAALTASGALAPPMEARASFQPAPAQLEGPELAPFDACSSPAEVQHGVMEKTGTDVRNLRFLKSTSDLLN